MTTYVGKVYYRAHSATPIVIGDFEVMKRWPGDPDGDAEGELAIGDDCAIGFSGLELASPHVFSTDRGATLLIPPRSYGRNVAAPTGDALQRVLDTAAEEVFEEYSLAVPSGALVITIAYNATPEEGAQTTHLDDRSFHEQVPLLPRTVPSEPVYQTELAIVPVRAGRYAVEIGRIDGFERCRLSVTSA
jgi:hypothetical protein